MKKESLRFAALALCISAACSSAYSAGNSTSNNSSGNSATTETSTGDAARSTAANQSTSDRDAAKNMPGADSKVPLSLNRASKVIGTNVEDSSGNKIGDIKDVVLDRKSGQVAYAVVDFGGWLGMGDKYFAVPWKSLKTGTNDRYVLNDVTKDTLKKAPGFDKDHWPDMASESWNRENAQAYNQKPYWEHSTALGHRHHGSSSGSSKGAGSSKSGTEKEPVSKSQ